MKSPTSRVGGATYAAVISCFFFSGASALVYQVVWVRMLGLVFGATALAVSTVLASFMAGLALGSYVFGRQIDRRGNPLVIYGLLEIGIGLFAVLFPHLLDFLNTVYRPLYAGGTGNYTVLSLARFALSFALLLLPTTFMGATLPVLTKFVVGGWGELGKRLGTLYSVNTWGAVVGSFGTGFLLIPHLGLHHTVLVAVAANVAVGSGALLLWRTGPARAAARRTREGSAGPETRGESARDARPASTQVEGVPSGTRFVNTTVLVAFGMSGFVALSLEVIWTRLLAMILGTTVYAFTTMLTTFLVGIALGSFVISRVTDRVRNLVSLFGFMEAGLGLSALLTLFFFGRFPETFLRLYWQSHGGWWGVVGIKFLLASAAMFLPTFFMGTTFPVVAKIYARDMERLGGGVGTAYAFNTVGAILGSIAGGFFFLPRLGVESGTAVAALLAVTVGLFLLGPASMGVPVRRRVAQVAPVALAALAVVYLRPAWNPLLLSRGVYVYAPQYKSLEDVHRSIAQTTLLEYDEEPGGTVSVERMGGHVALRIDGKVDASNAADMITQVYVAHLPLMLHPHPESVLVVGLGSGVTVGSVEQHPVKDIECVEISDGVIQASRFFGGDNHDCLADPRLTMIHGDGRNHVLLTERKYDVIISQPSNPWIAGIGSLFTREFFQLAKARLAPHGVMCQWFQSYQMSDRDFRATIHTFRQTFPHMTFWMSAVGDMVMLGSLDDLDISLSQVRSRMSRPSVQQDLARVGLGSADAFLTPFLMDAAGVANYAGRSPILHTDDNLLLEFSASRNLFQDTSPIHLGNILEHRQPVTKVLADTQDLMEETRADLDRRYQARGLAFESQVERGWGNPEQAAEKAGKAYDLAPDDPLVAETYAEIHFMLGNSLFAQGAAQDAILELEKAARPTVPGLTYSILQNLGSVYFEKGEIDKSLVVWQQVLEIDDTNPDIHYNRGQALSMAGRVSESMASYERSVALDPDKSEALNNLAWLYAENDVELPRAEELSRRAVKLAPTSGNYDTLGWVYYKQGQYAEAVDALRKAVKIDPESAESFLHLGLAYREQGDSGSARDALQQAVRHDQPQGDVAARAQSELRTL